MKICFLSTFYPFRGGIAQFNANLLLELRTEGHIAVPFTFTRQYIESLFPGKTQYVTEKDRAIKIDSIPIMDPANPFTWTPAAIKILREKPDVLFLRYWMVYFAPSLTRIARIVRRRGVKVVCLVDNAIGHEPKPFEADFATRFFHSCDEIIVMSDKVRSDVLMLEPKASIHLARHPLYTNFGKPILRADAVRKLGLNPSRKILLFFGLIRDYKGLDLLLDAINMLDDAYQLVIAGESYGPFEKYQPQIEQANASDSESVKVFNRYIDDEEVSTFFSAADLCVLPYRSATQSGITAIAYNFEVPMVATPVGSLSDDIARTGVGLVADAITPEAISAVIRKFFSMPQWPFVEAIQREKKELTWDKLAKLVVKLGSPKAAAPAPETKAG
jgi:Glycosyltransferase